MGFGSEASVPGWNDCDRRTLNLPHVRAVKLPFNERSGSHGFKALGRNFPEPREGWYSKAFTNFASDLGKHINIEFVGVFATAASGSTAIFPDGNPAATLLLRITSLNL